MSTTYFIFWVLMYTSHGGSHWEAHGTFDTLQGCQITVAIWQHRQRHHKRRNPAVCLPEGTQPRGVTLL